MNSSEWEKPNRSENKLIFQIHLVVHQIIVAPSMTHSLACEPSVHPFLSHVLWLSSSGVLGLLHMVDSTLPQKLLGSWIHIGLLFLSEWMDGEQQNWRNSVKCIDAFVAHTWILTSGAGHIHV